MANGKNFSASQQSTLGLSSAQARAVVNRSNSLFQLGKTAKVEELALNDAVKELERLAKKATRNAQKRARRSGIGRLVGAVAGTIVGAATKSPKAAKAAMTAVGGLIGGAAAGGGSIKSNVPSQLAPGGIFYAKDREELETKIGDFKDAVSDINKEFDINLGKSFIMDFMTGRAFAEAGSYTPTGSELTLDEMYKAGNITFKQYLGDSLRYFMPGGEKIVDKKWEERFSNVVTDEEFAKTAGKSLKLDAPQINVKELDVPESLKRLFPEESNVLDMSELEKGLFFGDPSTALPGGEYYIGPAMSRENLLQSILNEQVPIGEGLSVNPYSQLSPEGQRAFVEEQMSKYRIGVDPTTISRPLSQEQINKERFGWIDEAKEYVSTLSEETPETTASIEPVESLTLPESIDNNYLLGNLSKIDYKEGEVMIAEDVHFLKKLLDSGLMNKEQYDRFTLNPFESLNLGKKQYGDNVLFQPQRGTSFINEGF